MGNVSRFRAAKIGVAGGWRTCQPSRPARIRWRVPARARWTAASSGRALPPATTRRPPGAIPPEGTPCGAGGWRGGPCRYLPCARGLPGPPPAAPPTPVAVRPQKLGGSRCHAGAWGCGPRSPAGLAGPPGRSCRSVRAGPGQAQWARAARPPSPRGAGPEAAWRRRSRPGRQALQEALGGACHR